MYCSNACKLRVWKLRNPNSHEAHRATEASKGRAPRPPKVRTVSAYFTGYCPCGVAMGGRMPRKRCAACTGVWARDSAIEAGLAKHREDAKVTICQECDCAFCPLYGSSHAALCAPCKDARARAQKATHRALRKAKERAARVESVDPFKVFARDGWRCKICGVATPRERRGTYEPDAPELDHVVPLAKGGEHSYANTQCACRQCNGMKSDLVGWTREGEGWGKSSRPSGFRNRALPHADKKSPLGSNQQMTSGITKWPE